VKEDGSAEDDGRDEEADGIDPEASEEESPVERGIRRGGLIAGAGGLFSIAGLFVFRDMVFQPRGVGAGHGFPLWSFGLLLVGAGGWEIALSRSPRLAERVRRWPILPVLLGLGLLVAVGLLTYR
jgi:hypothetical protein